METLLLSEDIVLMCVKAASFPDGIQKAFNTLNSFLPAADSHKFYGISFPQGGNITYKAAVAVADESVAAKNGLELFTIKKGRYICKTLTNWRANERVVGETFQQLLSHPDLDRNGCCIEDYITDADMVCMVRLNDNN